MLLFTQKTLITQSKPSLLTHGNNFSNPYQSSLLIILISFNAGVACALQNELPDDALYLLRKQNTICLPLLDKFSREVHYVKTRLNASKKLS